MGPDRDITIRKALVTEAPLLTALMRQAFEQAYASHLRPEDLKSHMDANFTAPLQTKELEDPQVLTLLALTADEPIGYAQMLPAPFPECVKAERPVQLLRFYLLKPFWGSEAAGKLMQHCLLELSRRRYTWVWLSAWEQNERAQAFYRKWGFRAIGTAPFIVGNDRQTDNIMARPVSPSRADST
jgi:ribosomal protein S18 acetylase RimI-like enzyme